MRKGEVKHKFQNGDKATIRYTCEPWKFGPPGVYSNIGTVTINSIELSQEFIDEHYDSIMETILNHETKSA